VRGYWENLRNAVARRIRYRVTVSGIVFALATLPVGFVALTTGNNLLFLVMSAMLATLLVSGLVSRLCLAGLELDFRVPEHVPARRGVPGMLYVRNRKWLMPSFSIRVEAVRDPASPTLKSGVYFPLVAAGATLEEPVEARFPRRGAYRQNSFAFYTAFPFGFLEKSARVTLRRDMVVYPAIDPRPGLDDLLTGINGEIETHYRGLGRDFYRIRPYEALESARHLDWKATAHVGAPQVREFAREQEQAVELFLDRDMGAEFDDWFENAVECCAFLAWSLSSRGVSIHFRSQGYSFRQPEEGDIYTVLKYLALVYPRRTEAAEPPFEDQSYQIVFTPSPRRFTEAGWAGARLLGPADLPTPARTL
jgi:uncharacterized protein (DUF58 family)